MVLRDATPADLDTLVALVRDFCAHFDYPFVESSKRDSLERVLAEPHVGHLFLILGGDGAVTGYLFLSFYFSLEYGGSTAFVDELYIRPEHRGEGLGSKALKRALEAARGLGLTAVHLEAERSNPRAAALYVRLGFVDYDRTLLTYRL